MQNLTTFRPGGARAVAYGVAVVLLVLTAVIAVALPSDIEFTPPEVVTLGLILGATLALLHGVGRSCVRESVEGLEIVNGYKRRTVAWSDIAGIAMNRGAPWPTLVTTNDERIILFAIQGSDGPTAKTAVDHLRGRLQ